METRKVLIINTVEFTMGGMSSVIMNYYDAMEREGLQIDVVVNTRIEKTFADRLQANGSRIYRMKRNANPLFYMGRLYRIMRENHYDVVHVHGNSATMTVDLLPALLAHCPVRIAHSHNSKCDHQNFHRILKPLFRRCYTQAMACSREAGEWMFGDAYLLLPNGINVSRYRYSETVRRGVREELHLEGRIVLGHVGFMNEQKNHQKLLAILEAMQPKCDQVHLLCVTGSEEVPQDLQRIIREKQLQDRITVLHRRNDVHRLLQAMDVFVFPSLWEGLSVALLEAQASGLPCIVSDGISRESDQSGHVQFVGVDEPEDIWCERILSALGGASESRAEGCDALERSSYNIDHCCRILESIYRGNENGEMRY